MPRKLAAHAAPMKADTLFEGYVSAVSTVWQVGLMDPF
jgi:hypothetical protein